MEKCVHRSLLRSISPNSSLLPPLLDVAADVADPAKEAAEKEDEGLLARTYGVVVCCLLAIGR